MNNKPYDVYTHDENGKEIFLIRIQAENDMEAKMIAARKCLGMAIHIRECEVHIISKVGDK